MTIVAVPRVGLVAVTVPLTLATATTCPSLTLRWLTLAARVPLTVMSVPPIVVGGIVTVGVTGFAEAGAAAIPNSPTRRTTSTARIFIAAPLAGPVPYTGRQYPPGRWLHVKSQQWGRRSGLRRKPGVAGKRHRATPRSASLAHRPARNCSDIIPRRISDSLSGASPSGRGQAGRHLP